MRRAYTILTRSFIGTFFCLGLLLGWCGLHHERLLTVQSGSMEPTFYKGDALVVHTNAQLFHIGDVISYRSPANPAIVISHRVQHIDYGRYVLQGDALSSPDPTVARTQIIGRATAVLPHLGSMLNFGRSPLGLAIFVYIPAVLVVVEEVHRVLGGISLQTYRAGCYRPEKRQLMLD